MDLCVSLGDGLLNIRVAVIVEMHGGFLFEKNPKGWYYLIGGRIMIGETSEAAAIREVDEELGVHVEQLQFLGLAENFFEGRGSHIHELCFFYRGTIETIETLPEGFVVLTPEEMEQVEVLPHIVREWVHLPAGEIRHTVIGASS